MRKRKNIPVGTLFMILILALATLGVGYGMWSKLLVINGTVHTGKVDAVFVNAFTDDDGKIDLETKDAGDTGTCDVQHNDPGSCDPSSFGDVGAPPTRYDKDVGHCIAVVDPADETHETLKVTVENGYPSYHCTVWFDIENNGTIPVMIQEFSITPVDFENGTQVTVELSHLSCGTQIDPAVPVAPACASGIEGVNCVPPEPPSGEPVQADIHIHVEQAAEQDHTYTFTGNLKLVQWNEYDPDNCPVPMPVP
jgi:hypothetical protein